MSNTRLAGTSPSALASWATTGPVAGGRDELGGVVDLAGQRVVAARVGAEAPARLRAGSARPRAPRAAAATSTSSSPFSCATSARPPCWTWTARASAASGRGIASASAASSASSSRRSGSRSSQSRNTVRRFARSGVRVNSASRSRSTGTSRTIVASCLDSRAASACVGQVLLALGAGDLVDVAEHALEVAEALQQLGGGLVADARDARDVVAGVALEADEVRDLLGRDAVALDHALAVVDLGVGDAARGGHDPHAVADELVGVAVAGDDHHGDVRARAPARRARRSRRRPRSPRRRCSGSRTPRPAGAGAATGA